MRLDEGRRGDHKRAALAHLVDAGELGTAAVLMVSGERLRRLQSAIKRGKGMEGERRARGF